MTVDVGGKTMLVIASILGGLNVPKIGGGFGVLGAEAMKRKESLNSTGRARNALIP